MPDERKRIVEEFSAQLHAAYQKSGIASYSELADRLEKASAQHRARTGRPAPHVSRSTAYSILQGRRERLPTWDQVGHLVYVFHTAALSRDIHTAEIGTMEEWKSRYDRAADDCRAAVRRASSRVPALTAEAAVEAPPADEDRTWWRDYADFVPAWFERYLNHEPLADRITSYEPYFVPGLLQTPAYAAEVIALEHGHEPAERLARRLELRLLRQRHLERGHQRPQMWAVIREEALRNALLSKATMRAQILHLLHLGRHIRVQVLPASHPDHDAADEPITVLRFPPFDLPDLVYLEQADGALYPSGEELVAHYGLAVITLGLVALRPEESKTLLRRLAAEI